MHFIYLNCILYFLGKYSKKKNLKLNLAFDIVFVTFSTKTQFEGKTIYLYDLYFIHLTMYKNPNI